MSFLRVIFSLFKRVNANWGLWTVGAAVESVLIAYNFIPEITSIHPNYVVHIYDQNQFTSWSFHHFFIQILQFFICWCVLFWFLFVTGLTSTFTTRGWWNRQTNHRRCVIHFWYEWRFGNVGGGRRRGRGEATCISFGTRLDTGNPKYWRWRKLALW